VAICVDGYHHLLPERQARDQAQQDCMEDCGFTVIRFGLLANWQQLFEKSPALFGLQK
jgi:very-short-patch-repair endonuclease